MRGGSISDRRRPPLLTLGPILLAKSVLPICSWDWQISEPTFYEAIAPSDGCTDGFASRVREFADGIPPFVIHTSAVDVVACGTCIITETCDCNFVTFCSVTD